MQISRPDKTTLRLSRLDAFLVELLRRVAKSADPGDSAAARARLFSAPTHDGAEAEFVEDWQAYVEPELRRLFLDTLEIVEGDMRKVEIDQGNGEGALSIPLAHLESWIHSLNQARLVLAARYAFTEQEMERTLSVESEPRALALVQVRFYGVMQEVLLRELEGD